MEKHQLKGEFSHLDNTVPFNVKKTGSEEPITVISNSGQSIAEVTSFLNIRVFPPRKILNQREP